jgi:hypothetical protein
MANVPRFLFFVLHEVSGLTFLAASLLKDEKDHGEEYELLKQARIHKILEKRGKRKEIISFL